MFRARCRSPVKAPGRIHRTAPLAGQRAAVMVLLEAAGIGLPLVALFDLADWVVKATDGDPAGALLRLAGVESIEDA